MSLGSGEGWITPVQKHVERRLTPGQQKVLNFIRSDVRRFGMFPKNKRIAEQLAARPEWVQQVLNSLHDLGYITQARIIDKPVRGQQRVEWLLVQGRN